MTRKNESGIPAAAANKAAASVRSLRSQVDKLDQQLLKLVNERASLAAEIGQLKTDHGGEVFSPAREEEVLQNVLLSNKGPLDNATVRAIFRELMSGSRALQKVLKVAYLGPEDSFSHWRPSALGQSVEYMRGAASCGV